MASCSSYKDNSEPVLPVRGVVRGVVAMDVVALVVPVTVPGLAAAARCISVVVAWRLDRDGGDEGGVPWGSMDPMDAKSNGCAL